MANNKVFFDVGISLEGFMAGPNRSPDNPMGDGGGENLHKWVFEQQSFRENLKLGKGGKTGRDNRILEEIWKRTGAHIMGKRMFDEGELSWPEEAPFHTPVFVLTKEVREPWKRPGGTTFYFVNDGIESALMQARKAAGGKDVRISGGANTIQQYLNAGLIDEFTIHSSPVFLGEGLPLFAGISKDIKVRIKNSIASTQVTHISYEVDK